MSASLRIKLQDTIHIGKSNGKHILGLPIEVSNININKLRFLKIIENIHFGTGTIKLITLRNPNKNKELYTQFPFQVNFYKEVITYTYINIGDLFSTLGGLKSSLSPILDLITPILILSFLY